MDSGAAKRTVERILTIAKYFYLVVSVSLLLILLSRPSANAEILFYSKTKAVVCFIILLVSIYLLISSKIRVLNILNTYTFVILSGSILLFEIYLRMFITSLPVETVQKLPEAARIQFALSGGYFKEDVTITGSGLFYHYIPGLKLRGKPHVKIDSYGFRNAETLQDNSQVDVALFGDSVAFAMSSKMDLAAHFIQQGKSAVNYAMGGYSAAHYPLAIKKLLIDKQVRADAVILAICMANDIPNTADFHELQSTGGSFRQYLKQSPQKVEDVWMWSLHFLTSVCLEMKERYIDASEEVETREISVALPWGPIVVPYSRVQYSAFPENSREWILFKEALEQAAELSKQQGAKRVIFALFPSDAAIYRDYFVGVEKELDSNFAARTLRVKRITQIAENVGAEVIDMAPPLRKAAQSNSVSADGKTNYHLNDYGVEVAFEYLTTEMAKSRGKAR